MKYEIIEKVVHDTSGLFSTGDITNRPCPAITVGGQQINACHYQIHYRLSDTPPHRGSNE